MNEKEPTPISVEKVAMMYFQVCVERDTLIAENQQLRQQLKQSADKPQGEIKKK